jgi:hypothetical protein
LCAVEAQVAYLSFLVRPRLRIFTGIPASECADVKNYAPVATRTPITTVPACPAIRTGIWLREKMAWQSNALGEICARIEDPVRNGYRSLHQILTI